MTFKEQWDLESAMKVLEHQTVDSKLWAEAVEWLILYGPPEIQKILLEASSTATKTHFPELKPSHYTADGQPVYDVAALAQSLGISQEEVLETINRKELEHDPFSPPEEGNVTIH